MDFMTFAGLLRPIIGGESADGFVYELFDNITIFPEDKTNIVEETSWNTFKCYFTGDRKITEFAKKINEFVEPEKFVAFLENKSDAIQSQITTAFSPYILDLNAWNMCEKVSELFENIILTAASTKRKRKKQTELIVSDDSSITDTDILLLSSGLKCPLCNSRLVLDVKSKAKGQYKAVHIFPTSLDLITQQEFLNSRTPPPKLDSIANQIMVCTSCAESYEYEPTLDEYIKLADAKQEQAKNSTMSAITREIEIEDGVKDILTKLSSLTGKPEGATEIKWDGFCVEQKIPENYKLQNSVVHWVLTNYRFIEGEFKQAARSKTINYKKVRNEINQCFESLYEKDLPQQEIFDKMVDWVCEQTGHQDKLDCQIVVAFFIQNCEVFYDTSE